MILGAAQTHAADFTKANNTDNLNLSSSWTNNAVPGGSDIAIWDSTVTGANTSSISNHFAVAGIQILNPGGPVTLSSAGYWLTLNASGIDMSAATQDFTVATTFINFASAADVNVAAERTLTLASQTYFTGNVNKSGDGLLKLTGIPTANGGGITISAGTFELNNNSGTKTIGSPLSGTGTLKLTGTGQWSSLNANNSAFAGTVVWNGPTTGYFSRNDAGSTNASWQINTTVYCQTASGGTVHLGELSGTGTLTSYATPTIYEVGAKNTDSTFAGIINAAYSQNSLNKVGSGTLTLTGANTYTGATNVNGGTLRVNNSLAAGSAVTVATGGILGGSGTIAGTVNVQSGGTLAAGTSDTPGTLTLNNTVTLDSASTTSLRIDKTGATLTADKIAGTGTLSLAGTLVVTASGDALTGGDSFTLFAKSRSGSFATITLPTLAAGLEWDTSSLVTSGTIQVLASGTTATPTFSVASGTYPAEQWVTLSCVTAGSTIYYSTDDGITYTPYFAEILVPISTTLTIRTYATSTGNSDSPVTSATYTTVTPFTKADNTDNLNLASSWLGGFKPEATDVAVWDYNVTGLNTTTMTTNQFWGGVQIVDPGGPVTINGPTNTWVYLGSSGIDMSAATQDLQIDWLAVNANQTWNVPSGRTLTLSNRYYANSYVTLAGGGNIIVNASDSSIPLAGDNSGFTGSYTGTGFWYTVFSSDASASANARWINNQSNFALSGSGTGPFQFGALSGTGTVFSASGGGTKTMEVGALGIDTTCAGPIVINGANDIALTKVGTGMLTLSSSLHSYTGATTVNDGTLRVTGTLGATAVTVAIGATLDAGSNTPGNEALGASLAVNPGGHLAIHIAADAASQVTRTLTGVLTLADGNLVDLSAAATPAAGTYTLVTAGSISGTPGSGSSTLMLPSGTTGTLSVSGNSLILTISSGGYEAWASANGVSGGINGDSDNDGVPNGIEYFMGLTSESPVFTALPGVAGGQVTWPKGGGYTGSYGTDFVVETSSDLITWIAVGAEDVNLDLTTAPVTYTLPTGTGKIFTRLAVTGP